MPFEISPKFIETETKPARFQRFADAMLAGCARTKPSIRVRLGGSAIVCNNDVAIEACAYYAMAVGLGTFYISHSSFPGFEEMRSAYAKAHGKDFVEDYEERGLTREEIAANIAAL